MKLDMQRIARYRKAYPMLHNFLTNEEIMLGLSEERAKKREINNYLKSQIIKNS